MYALWEKNFFKIQSTLFKVIESKQLNTLRWFPSCALRIPTAHDFYVISVRKWAHARTKRKGFPSH